MMNWNTFDENTDIKKIIDPKNGYTLYLRKFRDTAIFQVSPDASFPIIPSHHDVSMATQLITEKITLLHKQSSQLVSQHQTTTTLLLKKIHWLGIGLCMLAGLVLASIFF